jgi:branched-chain amino acid transport system substrate-binding protein
VSRPRFGLSRIVFAALMVGALALGLAACGGSAGDNQSSSGGDTSGGATASGGPGAIECENGHITIGIDKAKSGVNSFFDVAGTNGFKIAVKQINEKGGLKGCPIKLIEGDTKSEPAVGAQVAKQQVEEGAQILVVPDDFDEGIAAARVGEKEGLLTLSLAASSTQFGAAVGEHFFSSGITTTQLGNAQAELALEKGWKTAFQVVDPGLAYNTEQVETFNEIYEPGGGEIVGEDKVDGLSGQSDYSSTISKIKEADPEVIQALNEFPQTGTFLKQLRAAGITTPVVSNVTFDTRELPKLVGAKGLEGVYYATQVYYNGANEDPKTEPTITKFTEEYEEEFGHFPEQENAAAAFQSFIAIDMALEEPQVNDAQTASEAISAQKNLKVPGGTLVEWKDGYAVWNTTIVGFTPSGGFEKIAVVKP